jgi:hypothetical protein
MKVNLKLVKKMVLDVIFIKMEIYIKDNGLITKNMEMEPKLILINKNTLEIIIKIKNQDKEYLFITMVIYTPESF